MAENPRKIKAEAWSAPESGTDRDDTTGNQPSDRANSKTAQDRNSPRNARQTEKDDPSFAQEES